MNRKISIALHVMVILVSAITLVYATTIDRSRIQAVPTDEVHRYWAERKAGERLMLLNDQEELARLDRLKRDFDELRAAILAKYKERNAPQKGN